jgi:hypothetical protein
VRKGDLPFSRNCDYRDGYVAARLALLSDLLTYVGRGGAGVDDVLLSTRRSLEADRFGLLAHLLAIRDACTSRIAEHPPSSKTRTASALPSARERSIITSLS